MGFMDSKASAIERIPPTLVAASASSSVQRWKPRSIQVAMGSRATTRPRKARVRLPTMSSVMARYLGMGWSTRWSSERPSPATNPSTASAK